MTVECHCLSALLLLNTLLAFLQYIELINYLMNILKERIYIAIVLSSGTVYGSLRNLLSLILLLVRFLIFILRMATRCPFLGRFLLVKSLPFKGAHQRNVLDRIINPL